MAGINPYLEQILTARYGEDVRGAIHDALEQTYADVDKPNVDTGLTVSGDAADAKETGDRIRGLENDLAETNATVGRVRTQVVGLNDYVSNLVDVTNSTSGKAAEAKVTGDTLEDHIQKINALQDWKDSLVDVTLSTSGKAAEAKATGDALEEHAASIEALELADDELKSALAQLNYNTNQFNWTSGVPHSSRLDRVKINIANGEKFYITVTATEDLPYGIFLFKGESSINPLSTYANRTVELTADDNYDAVGIYIGANSTYVSQAVSVLVEKENSILRTVSINKTRVERMEQSYPRYMRNGSYGNKGNPNAVTLGMFMLPQGLESISFETNRPLDSGAAYYSLGYYFVKTSITDLDPNYSNVINAVDYDLPGTVRFGTEISVPKNAKAVAITIAQIKANSELVPLRVSTFGNYQVCADLKIIDYEPTIAKIKSDLTPLAYATSEFYWTSGQAHSSTKDKVDIDIAVGDIFYVTVNADYAIPFGVWGYKADGQNEIILELGYGNRTYQLKATNAYRAIGIYIGTNSTLASTNVNVLVEKNNSVFHIVNNAEYANTNYKINSARHTAHASGSNVLPTLTLIHFSDLHADADAMKRIVNETDHMTDINDIICTGDMVSNTATQIAEWWNSKILTCIGNHDTASYNASTGYDWTALSMADRDSYYIAPFESNWGIVHTSGRSYYYKDYTDANVRLIVMDGMLYNNAGAEATAQTTWLSNLLSDAITNNLHVIIAIHAPHGGATAQNCSFSRYGQTAMPTNSDCNTPQSVIDVVATAIGNGLHFIGYLVGHTHQDNVWDAEGDGSQLMYSVTCAAVTQTSRWIDSDQYRDDAHDAYNIITVDTNKTLIKLIRGGGANIDDHMRTRKAICFNYSTGEMVGEVL